MTQTQNTSSQKKSALPEGWKEVSLGDVGKVVTGKTPSKNNPDDWNGNTDFITPSDLKTNSKYILSTSRNISEIGKERFKKMIIPKNTIIVTCIGSDMGKIVINRKKALTNQQINSLIVNDNYDFNFIYYLLKKSYKILRQNAEQLGSTMPILNKTNFEKLTFSIPLLPQQKSIAKILSSFDDKIELLREQNETLENIGQEIFKEWFGKYKIGDELPEGWRVGKVKDLGKIVCGKTPLKSNKDNFGGEIPFIKIPDMHGKMFILNSIDTLSEKGANSQINKIIPKNSLSISCIATVGLVIITTKKSQTNQQINSIIPNNDYMLEYGYYLFKKMYKYLNDIGSGGTATLNVNTSTFSNIEIIIPNKEILKKFNNLIKPLFEKIKNNSEEIQELESSRDLLLPRLMRGEILVD